MKFDLKFTLLLVLLSSTSITSAQQDNVLTLAEFESIKFNSHSMKQLMDVTDYETFLEQHYGIANNKRCSNNPDMPYGCDLFYNGFTLGFDYDDVLMDITITGGTNSFFYKNKELKPGMSIFEIKSIFPNSYNKRYKVTLDGKEQTFMRVVVGRQYSERLILFKLNTSLNIVSEIHIGTGSE